MTFHELDSLIALSRRRSIASALIAILVDSLDRGETGLDLDRFLEHTAFIRNNVTQVARYLESHGVLNVHFYRESREVAVNREYVRDNIYGRWAKQHYQLTVPIKALYHRA
jgi:hypothetical protein